MRIPRRPDNDGQSLARNQRVRESQQNMVGFDVFISLASCNFSTVPRRPLCNMISDAMPVV